MGLSVSAATVILLIGIAGVLLIAYPRLESGVSRVTGAVGIQTSLQSSIFQTSFQISNLSVNGTCAKYNLTVRLNNTGSANVRLGTMSFFDNGGIWNATTNGTLAPYKDINITYVNMSSVTVSHRFVAVAENGVAAYGTYRCS